jgi:hypothetical protein
LLWRSHCSSAIEEAKRNLGAQWMIVGEGGVAQSEELLKSCLERVIALAG